MYGTNLNIITITEFQNECPEVDISQYVPATISGMITDASGMVSDYLRYTPIAEDIVDEVKEAHVTTEGDLIINPAKPPIVSVSALAVTKGTTTLNITLTSSAGEPKYNLDFAKRYLRVPGAEIQLSGTFSLNSLYSLRESQFYTKMSYRGGFEASAIPPAIKQACILFVRELLSRRFNTSGAKKISQGGISVEYSMRNVDDDKSDLVKDAERLLRPYRRIG